MSLALEILPDRAAVVRRGRRVVAACWHGPRVLRPFVAPFTGPDGVELTRLGHPEDPVGHAHHRSIWIGHADVDGIDFWSERPGAGAIETRGVEPLERTGDRVGVLLHLAWRASGGRVVLLEDRRIEVHDLPGEELGLDIACTLRAPRGETADGDEHGDGEESDAAPRAVTLGVTNFGLLGVRVARTMRVREGLGGRILNSQEGEDEAGCFGQHAAWCDTSGPVPLPGGGERPPPRGTLPAGIFGIACFDHLGNAAEDSSGTRWHVRDDGWMGPSLTRDAPRTVRPGAPLVARYRVEAHAGRPGEARIDERWGEWTRASRD